MNIRLKFKSFYVEQLSSATQKFFFPNELERNCDKFNFLTVRGFVSLPLKKTVYTVLKSPHVNKKSREQFMYKCYSQNLNCSINNLILFKKDQDESFHLLNCLNQNAPEGVSTCLKYVL